MLPKKQKQTFRNTRSRAVMGQRCQAFEARLTGVERAPRLHLVSLLGSVPPAWGRFCSLEPVWGPFHGRFGPVMWLIARILHRKSGKFGARLGGLRPLWSLLDLNFQLGEVLQCPSLRELRRSSGAGAWLFPRSPVAFQKYTNAVIFQKTLMNGP